MSNGLELRKSCYWGWVPILSYNFYIECENSDNCIVLKDFHNLDNDDVDKILSGQFNKIGSSYEKEMLLSDDPLDVDYGIMHNIELIRPDKSTNPINIKIIIKSPSSAIDFIEGMIIKTPATVKVLAEGTANIFHDGLVRYNLDKCEGDKVNCINQIHKIIRDIFHKHDHHSSDLPLPTVLAEGKDDAIRAIAKLYIYKFITYKRFSSKLSPKNSIECLHRGLGEIEYAKVFLNSNMYKLNNKYDNHFIQSVESFSESFAILLERMQDRVRFASNDLIAATSIYLLSFTIILSRPEFERFFQKLTSVFNTSAFNLSSDYNGFALNALVWVLFALCFWFATYLLRRSNSTLLYVHDL